MLDATDPSAFVAAATAPKPQLVIHNGDLPATAEAVRDLLASSGVLFDRGMPVLIVKPPDGGLPFAKKLTKHGVVREVHRLSQPVKVNSEGELIPWTLPERVAELYLDMHDWKLPPLNGISTAPLLSSDGSVRTAEGYDFATGLWSANVPSVDVPARPTVDDAVNALDALRREFRTFPFADAARRREGAHDVLDLEHAPELDESAFLLGLVTAVCRPSLLLSPGFLATAPAVTGAGSGKGLLIRAINLIAFGIHPRAFTMGGEKHELDKRLAAELIDAQPGLFLDNANGVALRSQMLESILTERPARVRILGQTRMVELNSTAFVAIAGNGLSVRADLVRRFIYCELDARCEDPESRPFAVGFLENILNKRAKLLAAVLTIWRYGRQNSKDLTRGKPLGSFEEWAEWCRDPLLTLGSRDPVERLEFLKANDPHRQRVAELFTAWWKHHQSKPVAADDLAQAIKFILDPHMRSRQYLAAVLKGYVGTRAAGFVLTRQPPAGRWNAATYALRQGSPTDATGH